MEIYNSFVPTYLFTESTIHLFLGLFTESTIHLFLYFICSRNLQFICSYIYSRNLQFICSYIHSRIHGIYNSFVLHLFMESIIHLLLCFIH